MVDETKLCKNCVYYDAKNQECHRYAPQPCTQEDQKKIRWPSTPPIGWCGECRKIPSETPEEAESGKKTLGKKPAMAGAKK